MFSNNCSLFKANRKISYSNIFSLSALILGSVQAVVADDTPTEADVSELNHDRLLLVGVGFAALALVLRLLQPYVGDDAHVTYRVSWSLNPFSIWCQRVPSNVPNIQETVRSTARNM